MNRLGKVALCCLVGILCVVTVLLVHEYILFKEESKVLLDLQQEYRNYIVAVKKVLHNSIDGEHYIDHGKKKDINSITITDECNQEGDELEDTDAQFLLLNREPAYLKEAMIAHLQQENVEFLLEQIDINDLIAYTDQLLAIIKEPEEKQKNVLNKKCLHKKSTVCASNMCIKNKPLSSSIKRGTPDILLTWPIARDRFWLSSFFGPRKKLNGTWGYHYGIDMAALRGTPVKAAAEGVVIEATKSKGYGKTIVISHTKKYKTRYAHLDRMLVHVGQKVNRAQLIGKVGDTGFVRKVGKDASHLHFEVYVYSKKTNPMYFLT